MKVELLFAALEQNAHRIRALTYGVTDDEARWRPAPEHWSLLEVIAHLLEEERLDFRPRLDLLLHHPGQLGPPIDPQGWVVARRYNEWDVDDTLQSFLRERSRSLDWLRALEDPRWDHALQIPDGPRLQAGDILAAWAAHDVLHLRQLARIHWMAIAAAGKPYDVAYAGAW